ncbi:MAG: hypothetical protein L6R39_000055 [Caloplaca ligustica]|nr:MAG: hypothetical protein L6R39_000055 [Caloplaca ligustica]
MEVDKSKTNAIKSELLRTPIATPYWGAQGGSAFTVRAITTIDAPSSTVLEYLLDTSRYPEWNNFVPRVTFPNTAKASTSSADCHLREGVLFTEHVDMFGHGKPSGLVKMKLLVTTLEEAQSNGETNYKVVWLGKGYPDWALRSERVHSIICNSDGTTTYDVFETFSGPLALLVRLFVGTTLVKRFKQWNEELGQFAESHPLQRGVSSDTDLRS